MFLDKAKLAILLRKAQEISFEAPTSFHSHEKPAVEKKIGSLVTGLSGWLSKHDGLSNGASYGKKIAEIKAMFDSKNSRQLSYNNLGEKDGKHILLKLISLIKIIDKENKCVFIVHGRDEKMLADVKAALSGLGIYSVILSRENNTGQTIIEKFEKEAGQCEYAVVLCSADDEGRLRQKGKKVNDFPLRPRARQNVILELGYFLAKFGRENLFVLHPEESIEQPSDFYGVVYETFDKSEKWKPRLVRELREAGFKIPTKLSDRI